MMTEQEWLECLIPGKMIWNSRDAASDRKRILLGVACLRRIEQFLPGPISQQAVGLLERYADGEGTEDEMARMRGIALEEAHSFPNPHGSQLPETFVGIAVHYSDDVEMLMDNCAEATAWAKEGTQEAVTGPEEAAQSRLIREIIGNPFRPTAFDSNWRTSTVVSLARGIYESRDFSTMPILSDELQDAGCENDDILNHCRGDGPHVRGCWVVDMILGKN